MLAFAQHFIVVNTYQVAISGLDSLVDGLTDLTRGSLPGTEAQLTENCQ